MNNQTEILENIRKDLIKLSLEPKDVDELMLTIARKLPPLPKHRSSTSPTMEEQLTPLSDSRRDSMIEGLNKHKLSDIEKLLTEYPVSIFN